MIKNCVAALGIGLVLLGTELHAQKKFVKYLDADYQELKKAEGAAYLQIEEEKEPDKWKKTILSLPDSLRLMESAFIVSGGTIFANGPMNVYWPNGKLRNEYEYFRGVYHGVIRDYYENGNVESEVFYALGRRFGFSRSYYENGKPRAFTEYYCNEKWGHSVDFDENGIQDSTEYNAGSLIDKRLYFSKLEKLGIRRFQVDNLRYYLEYTLADGRKLKWWEGDMNSAVVYKRRKTSISHMSSSAEWDAYLSSSGKSYGNSNRSIGWTGNFLQCVNAADTCVFLLNGSGDITHAYIKDPIINNGKTALVREKGKWLGCDPWFNWAGYPSGEENLRTLFRVKTRYDEKAVPDNVFGEVTVVFSVSENRRIGRFCCR